MSNRCGKMIHIQVDWSWLEIQIANLYLMVAHTNLQVHTIATREQNLAVTT